MFCTKCGTQIPDDAQLCPQCQEPVQKEPPPRQAVPMQNPQSVEIKSGLVPAILVTLFCCLPFGVVAIVYAARVSGLVAAGDIAGARESARKANLWSMISLLAGLLGGSIYFLGSFLGAIN